MAFKKAWAGYTFYAILFAAVVLWLRFPAGLLAGFMEGKAAEAYPGLELSLEDVRPSPTFSLVLGRVAVSSRGGKGEIFTARDLSVRPEIRRVLSGEPAFRFSGLAYGGGISGRLASVEDSGRANVNLVMDLSGLQLGELEHVRRLLGREVTGRLSGEIDYQGDRGGDPLQGRAEARLVLAGVSLEYLELPPIVRLEPVRLDEVRAVALLEGGEVILEKAELDGPQFKASLSGVIEIQEPLLQSILDLKGEVKPSSEFFKGSGQASQAMELVKEQMRGKRKGSVSFSVSGTLGDPVVRLL